MGSNVRFISQSVQVCPNELNSSVMHLFAVGDATQLATFWLHSYIKVRLLNTYVIMDLNCCPATTTPRFVEASRYLIKLADVGC